MEKQAAISSQPLVQLVIHKEGSTIIGHQALWTYQKGH